jgi:hypothetical protein
MSFSYPSRDCVAIAGECVVIPNECEGSRFLPAVEMTGRSTEAMFFNIATQSPTGED